MTTRVTEASRAVNVLLRRKLEIVSSAINVEFVLNSLGGSAGVTGGTKNLLSDIRASIVSIIAPV